MKWISRFSLRVRLLISSYRATNQWTKALLARVRRGISICLGPAVLYLGLALCYVLGWHASIAVLYVLLFVFHLLHPGETMH